MGITTELTLQETVGILRAGGHTRDSSIRLGEAVQFDVAVLESLMAGDPGAVQ